jgi:dienelactone hydrolase
VAFAPDALSSVGGYPGDDYKGDQLFAKIDPAKRTQDFVTAAMWLKSRADCTGQIGATGFCFGGGMANTLAVLLGPDLAAAAPFYGGPPKPEDVPKIKAAILVHHGALDKTLSEGWPAQEAELKKTTSGMRATFTRIRSMVSSMTRPRNATTRSRPSRRGRAPLSGSTSLCAGHKKARLDNPIKSGWFLRPHLVQMQGRDKWKALPRMRGRAKTGAGSLCEL